MQEKILTPDQVAQVLQVHPFTVLKFIKQGRLKASKLGRVYRIRESDVEKFLDQSMNGGVVDKVALEPPVKPKNQKKTAKKSISESINLESSKVDLEERQNVASSANILNKVTALTETDSQNQWNTGGFTNEGEISKEQIKEQIIEEQASAKQILPKAELVKETSEQLKSAQVNSLKGILPPPKAVKKNLKKYFGTDPKTSPPETPPNSVENTVEPSREVSTQNGEEHYYILD